MLREIGLNANISHQEFSFSAAVTKSKLYEKYRCRFLSLLQHLSDDEIEEGISELENEYYHNVKNDELINYEDTVHVTKAKKA